MSRRRDLPKPTSMEILPAFRGRGADRRWGFGASYGLKVREETSRLSPTQSVTAFRLSSIVIGRCVPDYCISRYLEFLGFLIELLLFKQFILVTGI